MMGEIIFFMTKKASTHFIIKGTDITTSKQKETDVFVWMSGIKKPRQNWDDCIYIFEKSFIIGWLVDRIATTASNGWIFTDTTSDETKQFLQKIDQDILFKNLVLFGNAFFEKIRDKSGRLVGLLPFITPEVRIKKENGVIWYIQKTGTEEVHFDSDEIVHIKTSSITSRYYGDTKFDRCMRQVILLGLIDQFYEKHFSRWHIKSKIFLSPDNSINAEQASALQEALRERLSGLDNSYATAFIQGKLEALDLDNELDTEAFLDYRDKLIASIAVALNVPVDIIDPSKASRNTKAESLSELNNNIIVPLQERAMNQLIEALRNDFADIANVQFYTVSYKNNLEEMRVYTGYKQAGILTANEIRTTLGYENIADGDTLTPSQNSKNFDEEIEKIETEIKKIYE